MSEIKFKIGDKVRVMDNGELLKGQIPYIGKVGTVIDEHIIPDVKFKDGRKLDFCQRKLELVTEEIPEGIEVIYKVGDRQFNTLDEAKAGLQVKSVLKALSDAVVEDWVGAVDYLEIGPFLDENKELVLKYYGVDND